MLFFVLSLAALLGLCTFAFHLTLLGTGRFALSEVQWEGVDYIWYALATTGLALGEFQIQLAAKAYGKTQ